jgi:hypothetical protein
MRLIMHTNHKDTALATSVLCHSEWSEESYLP